MLTPDPDADIVALLRSSDGRERGAALLIRRHGDRIARLIGSMVPPADRDDVVQDAYIAAITRIASHDGRGGFAGWISKIATNLALDLLRRRGRTPTTALDAIDLERLLAADEGLSPAEMDRGALIACMRRQFESFAKDYPEHGRALFLFHFLQWDQKTIATVVGRTHDATRKFISDSRKRLKPYIAPCLDDPEPDPDPASEQDFNRWLDRLRGRLNMPPETAADREAEGLGVLFLSMERSRPPQPQFLADSVADILRGVRAFETRRSMIRRLALAATITITAGVGAAYWMRRREDHGFEVVEASTDFEARFIVRGARTRLIESIAPEAAARELVAAARAASVPHRLRRKKSEWIVDLFVAESRGPLSTSLEHLGIRIETDAPAISVRFVAPGG